MASGTVLRFDGAGRGKPLNDASGSTTLKLCRLDAIWDRRAGLGRVGFDERHQAPAVIVRVVVAQNGRAARLQEHVRSTDVLAVFGQVRHAKDGDVGQRHRSGQAPGRRV